MRLVAYMRPHEERHAEPVHLPGARSLWIVTMKLRPVRIDENPRMKTPSAGTTLVLDEAEL
jgi:hypothetical protein